MMVDVILPTYNRREFLPRAIDCIRAQTRSDWRLLVVNDGGESVADIVARYRDERIVLFDRPHAGKAAQLNFALARATAPYVAYMDDDDDVFPSHLERLLFAAETLGADFVYSDTYLTILDPDGKVLRRTVENERDAPYEEIRLYNRINHKQVLHARELIERAGGYDEGMRILIDFDGIKRLMAVARRPFHLREVTGEHFLRMDSATGTVSSISGLWKKDPEAAGRSLLRFFEKDPAALARLYRMVPAFEDELAHLRARLAARPSARLKRLLRHGRKPRPGVFRDALPPVRDWRDVTPSDGLLGCFLPSDQSAPSVAAVNRIAAGESSADVRRAAFARVLPPVSPRVHFEMSPVDGGWRFRSAAGDRMRWILLGSRTELPEDFALEFDYVPHSEFKEQLQFDFRMSSLGDRLRFMVRDNRTLVANAVEDGVFPPDGRRSAFSFEMGVASRVRVESCRGVHSLSVDGRSVLSLEYDGPAGIRGRYGALVFYDESADRPIDFEIRNFRMLEPA